jgi:response regulator NasT
MRLPGHDQSHPELSRREGAGKTMTTSLRVGIADDDAAVRAALEKMICALGHEVAFLASSGTNLVRECGATRPDLVITDIRMPDMDGLDAAKSIYHDVPTPIILLSGFTDRELIERAQENQVLAYLVKPIGQPQLEAAIVLVMRRFCELRALEEEATDLRQALADRKMIERAKGLVMKHWNVDEPEAFRRLQKLASSKNKKLIEIAEMILTAAEALGG